MHPDTTEYKIIEKAVAGNRDAFRSIVEKNQAFVFAVAFRFVNDKNDAQDIAQEVFIRLWNNLHKYNSSIKLTTWLYKIITNLCLDFLKSKPRRERLADLRLESGLQIADPKPTDGNILTDELRSIIIRSAEELTPKQKAVFLLRDVEELTIGEISEVLNMPTQNVKSNLHYARVKVADRISEYYKISNIDNL